MGLGIKFGVRITEGAHQQISLSIIHQYTETNTVWCFQRSGITLTKTQLCALFDPYLSKGIEIRAQEQLVGFLS